MKILKETDKYLLEEDEQGNTRICDKEAGCKTSWYVGLAVKDQLNLIENFYNDSEFDEYCRRELTDTRG